jgi:5-methylcytosine-specific restriction protein A
MATYLLTWNPNKWHWREMEADIRRCQRDGYLDDRWSCGRNNRIEPNDRVFLLRQGREPRGIIGSGWATSHVFEDRHWSDSRDTHHATARYINVRFDVLLNPDQTPQSVFRRDWLDSAPLNRVHWNTQMSGIIIPDDVASQLELEWARFLASHSIIQQHTALQHNQIVEATNGHIYLEGLTRTVEVTRYERNAEARRTCLREYGLSCVVCEFNFQQVYGDLGVGFIHVHHLIPLSVIAEQYELKPLRDLRPVCANCHAMLHQRTPPITIEELRSVVAAGQT